MPPYDPAPRLIADSVILANSKRLSSLPHKTQTKRTGIRPVLSLFMILYKEDGVCEAVDEFRHALALIVAIEGGGAEGVAVRGEPLQLVPDLRPHKTAFGHGDLKAEVVFTP